MSVETVKYLARKAADKGLRLRDARALFEALYIADAISLADGNVAEAARNSGYDRVAFHRRRKESENAEQWDGETSGDGQVDGSSS